MIISEPKSNCSYQTISLPECLVCKLELLYTTNSDAYLLTGESGHYLEPRTYQNHFNSYITAIGLENVNFHSLRHTFASRCVEVGFEIKSLSEILGHSNVNITLNCYVYPSLDLKRENMNKLSSLH